MSKRNPSSRADAREVPGDPSSSQPSFIGRTLARLIPRRRQRGREGNATGSLTEGPLTFLWANPDSLLTPANLAEDNLLGQGYFGAVYRGEWRRTMVAIKEVHLRRAEAGVVDQGTAEAVRDSFIRELHMLATLRHPNIVQLMGYCIQDDRGYLVLEHAANGSLDHWVFPSLHLVVNGGDTGGAEPQHHALWRNLQQLVTAEVQRSGSFLGFQHLRLEQDPVSSDSPKASAGGGGAGRGRAGFCFGCAVAESHPEERRTSGRRAGGCGTDWTAGSCRVWW